MEPTPLTPLWPSFEYRPHQTAAIEWMRTQEEDPYLPGGLLCDEMGLGKTMEVLGLIKNTKVSMNLLITPLAVLEQWTEAAVHSGINVFRMNYKRDWEAIGTHAKKTTFLFITHYDFAMRHNDELMTTVWNRIILDEAHRISNDKTLLFDAIHQIPAKNKWALTATPIINGLANSNALFQFLGMDKSQIPQSTKRLAPIIFEKALCRTVAELRPMIPSLPQKEVIHYHTLPFSTKDERDFYRGIQGAAVRRWTALQEEGAGRMLSLIHI
jgi:superfamily II DNA or RNA helicase